MPLEILELTKTCEACPAQWEGMVAGGQHLYIRYRWGVLRCDIGEETVYQQRVGGEYDGYMEDDEMQRHLADVITP